MPLMGKDRTMQQADTPARSGSAGWNLIAYITFVLAGILFTLWGSDRTQGPVFLALALVFDPYDATVTWKDRPRWTRVLLFTHIGLAVASLGFVMAR